MSKNARNSLSLLILLAGLGLWTLAPYGGCSCYNPMAPSSAPTPTPTPTQGPVIDDWEDSDLNNKWNGTVTTSIDTMGSNWSYSPGVMAGGYPGGTPGACIRMAGTIVVPVGPNYPYCAMVFSLGNQRNLLADFNQYNSFAFWAKSGVTGVNYRVRFNSPVVTDFGHYGFTFNFAVANTWTYFKVFFPRAGQFVAGGLNPPTNPEPDVTGGLYNLSQPSWAAGRPWYTGVKTQVDSIDFLVIEGASPQAFDLWIDDLTFLNDTF